MISMEVKIVNHLPQMTAGLHHALDQVGTKGAHDIEASQKRWISQFGAVDTGAMLGSVAVEDRGDLVWSIRPHVDYWVPVCFGHHTRGNTYVPARDFVTPALEENKDDIAEAVRQMIARFGT